MGLASKQFSLLATGIKQERWSITGYLMQCVATTSFDLVTLVQALQTLQTTTNSGILLQPFTLYAFAAAKVVHFW